jgi:hypothetical protein
VQPSSLWLSLSRERELQHVSTSWPWEVHGADAPDDAADVDLSVMWDSGGAGDQSVGKPAEAAAEDLFGTEQLPSAAQLPQGVVVRSWYKPKLLQLLSSRRRDAHKRLPAMAA